MKKIILGSTSPRRKALLELIGLPFEIVASDYEEDMTLKMPPNELVQFLSKGKASSVASKVSDGIIIGADTIVTLNGEVIGKPKSEHEAKEILKKLSGNTHEVLTGITIIDKESKKECSRVSVSKVTFREIPESEIDAYIIDGEPTGRSGAYAIQGLGSLFVENIDGDYYGIMGMPLFLLVDMFKEFDVNIWKYLNI